MLKKNAAGLLTSIIAVLGLVSSITVATASVGDGMDVIGDGSKARTSMYAKFTIASGDPNDDGVMSGAKLQPAFIVDEPCSRLIVRPGAAAELPSGSGPKPTLNIGSSDLVEHKSDL